MAEEVRKFSFRAPQEPFVATDFSFGRLLGVGSYSKVVQATKKDTGITYALKIMDKLHIVKEKKTSFVKMERLILDQVDHPGIIHLFFTFQDSHYLYMGLECCDGGELFDQVQRKGRLTLEETRFYIAELVEVMEYMHGQGLIHRDLKPENLLLTADGHLKVADFGSAKLLRPFSSGFVHSSPDENSSEFVGTAEYVSPEVINSDPITIAADLWALGCIMFQFLVGRPPFKGASEYLTFQKVLKRDFCFPDSFDLDAMDLINGLLDLDPSKRPGAGPVGYNALKSHSFFRGVEWSHVREAIAPPLAPRPKDPFEDEEIDFEDDYDDEWEFVHMTGISGHKVQHTSSRETQHSCTQRLKESCEVSASKEPIQELRNLNLKSEASPGQVNCTKGNIVNDRRSFLDSTNPSDEASSTTYSGPSIDNGDEKQLPPLRQDHNVGNSKSSWNSRDIVSPGNREIPDDDNSEWLRFLQLDEKILMLSLVKKHRRLSVKKRMLILTNRPRLFYIDPVKMTLKGDIHCSSNSQEMCIKVESENNFKICTPNQTYLFEDSQNQAQKWKAAIEAVLQ